jgi:hypothetical protein
LLMIAVTPKIVTDVEQCIHVLAIERLLLRFREGHRNGHKVEIDPVARALKRQHVWLFARSRELG